MTLREAATNVQRHARARNLQVRLRRDGEDAVLELRDDGLGGPIRPGNGLSGMRERIQALQGALEVASHPGQGTHLVARLPIRGAA